MSETIPAVRAELAKLRGVRSTFVALLLFAVLSVLVAALGGWSAKNAIESRSPLLRSDFTAEQAGLDGVLYGQLALIVFGVLVVSAEYASGMMRVSLLAVPLRGRLYVAKLFAAAAVAVAVAVPVTVVSYLVTQAALGSHGASIGASGVPRALAGAVVYLTLMCLFAASTASIARSAVVPLAVLLPMVLVGSHLLSLLGLTREVVRYLPDQAGAKMLAVGSDEAFHGLAVMLAWTVAAAVVGYLRHLRWDT